MSAFYSHSQSNSTARQQLILLVPQKSTKSPCPTHHCTTKNPPHKPPLPNRTHLKFRHVYSNSVHPQKHNKSTAHKRRKHALLVPHGHNKNKPRIVASQTRFRRKQTHKPLLTISDFSETLKPYPSLSVSLQIHFQWEILFLVLRN